MSFVDIFGWKLSLVTIEGNSYYLVDDSIFNLFGFGFASNKNKVTFMKELCFSKAKVYPMILRESGTVISSAGDTKKSKRLLPGDKYVLTPLMLNAMIKECHPDNGQIKLRVCCTPEFANSLEKVILTAPVTECPVNYTSSFPSETAPPLPPAQAPASSSTILRKRKASPVCLCRKIFKVRRIVSENASDRSKRRRVLAAKRMFHTLSTQLPSNVAIKKLDVTV